MKTKQSLFDISDIKYDENSKELSEGLIDSAQMATSMMGTPDNLGKLISKEVPILKIGLLLFKLFRGFKNLSTLQKINRSIFALGPISIIIIYMFLGDGIVRSIAEIFIKHIVSNLVLSKPLKILVRFIFKLADKGRQSVMAVFISMFLLPIGAFFTMLGSLLLKGDSKAQAIIQRQDIYWMKECLKLFKMISLALVETIPFMKPIIQFMSMIFQKISVMFKTGKTAATKAVKQAQQESMRYDSKNRQGLEEGFISSSVIFASISVFFFKILKTTKIIGIIGLVFVIIFKFFPGIKQLLMKLPLIGPIVTLAQTTGRSLASRFKLNDAANKMKEVQAESQEMQNTVSILGAITH